MANNSAPGNGTKKKDVDPARDVEELREKVRELEETLDAIRSGEVDAIVVSKGDARQVYTLEGADHPYRVLVENIREGALTLSRAGVILYTNGRFADMVKVSPDKVPGTSILDYVCPESQADIGKALSQITSRACRARVRIRQGEKESLPVYLSMNPLSREADTKISVVVTDRRKDEERLQMQARMLDAVGDAVIAADTKNKIIYWNDAATKTYGWERDEALGRDLIDVATPEISKKEAREIAERLKMGETWTGEYIVKHRDGHEFPIYASDAPIFDDDGKLIAIIGASHDITEQKKAERDLASRNQDLNALNDDLLATHEELRQTNTQLMRANESLKMVEEELLNSNSELIEEQLAVTLERDRVKNLLDIAGVMILTLDTKGKVTLINRRGCEILGRPEEEILGKDWVITFLPEDIRTDMKRAFRKVFAGEIGDFRSNENAVLNRDGDVRDILWSNALVKDGKGTITGILSSGEDITDRKRAEDELRHRHTALNAAYEEIASTQEELRQINDELIASNDALRRSEEELRSANADVIEGKKRATGERDRIKNLLDIAGVMILALDTKGHVTMINRRGCEILGYPEEMILGKDWVENFLPEDIRKGMTDTFHRVSAGRIEGFESNENAVISRDGRERYILWSNRLISDAGGKITGILSSGEDITDRKLAEEALVKNEESLKEALAEKEILLSEIHHRVKNNLTAFISLLSLEGSYEETPAGKALKKDLQNRARTMALIHETLYKTRQYADVDMDLYLSTLIGQVVGSYSSARSVKTVIDAKGVTLDLARATPIGLIINEIVTNSLKYAFTKDVISSLKSRKEPCTIWIQVTKENGMYLLKVYDNGAGLPMDFDLKTTQTLGLKLVNFLARHQLRAKPEVNREKGTEFVFRFKE